MWIVGSLGLGHTRERWKEEGKARTRERHRGTADDHSEGDALAMDTTDMRDTRDLTKLYGFLDKTSVIEGREGRAAEVRAGVRGVTTSETTSDDQPACKLLVQAEVGGIALEEGADQTPCRIQIRTEGWNTIAGGKNDDQHSCKYLQTQSASILVPSVPAADDENAHEQQRKERISSNKQR